MPNYIDVLPKELKGLLDQFKLTTVTITSGHHWNVHTKLVLKLDNDKLISKDWQCANPPTSVLDDIYQTFAFFGAGMEGLECQGADIKKIRDIIYKAPLAKPLIPVHLSTCGCNMGHCSMVENYKVSEVCSTYEDALKLWSDLDVDGFYEYPDSVFLYLDYVDEIPERWPHGHGTKSIPSEKLDNSKMQYFSWHYGR